MDLCVIDWRALTPIIASLIATGIASSTALYISNKWSKQKGGEVIAEEAKQTIKDILGMVKTINYVGHGLCESDKLKEELDIFLKYYESVVINTSFIKDSISDDDLKKAFKLYTESGLKITSKIFTNTIKVGDEKLHEIIREFGERAFDLLNTLSPYSTYRKVCKFEIKK